MKQNILTPGDFTGLASDYSLNRPDYSPSVLNSLLGLVNNNKNKDISFVDVGAGTGIWTRMVFNAGINSIIAVEPNIDMRNKGIKDSLNTSIIWLDGRAESTGLKDQSVDWLSMASSFHWADFEVSTKEFYRVIRPNGWFTAIWNPRLLETNPILVEIENHLVSLNPNIKRVSSGRSGITEFLTDKLISSPYFDDVVYIEGRHTIRMSKDRYLGAWRSVNDLRVQLGIENFNLFLDFVKNRICKLDYIDATYLTRSWSARRRG